MFNNPFFFLFNHPFSSSQWFTFIIQGGLPSKSETSGLNGPTQDTIFDHIRKKAQYFPALSRTLQFDSVAETKEYSFENQPDFCIAASQGLKEVNTDRSTGDTIVISDSETRRGIDASSTEPGSRVKDDKFSRSPHGERGSSSAPPRVSCINTDPSSIEMLPFDISMIKHNTRLAGSRNSTAYGRKKQSSPNGSKRHCCSLEMAGKNREVDSFLGFTSVFSFLWFKCRMNTCYKILARWTSVFFFTCLDT